jgi:hypothetical protein
MKQFNNNNNTTNINNTISKELPEILSLPIVQKVVLAYEKELQDIKDKKTEVVKGQRYEEAAKLRDVEKQLQRQLEEARKKWVIENGITPPLQIGARITKGIITGICKHNAARYLVKENGCNDENRWILVKFEHAIPA